MGASELKAVKRVLDSDVLSGFIGGAGSQFNGEKRSGNSRMHGQRSLALSMR